MAAVVTVIARKPEVLNAMTLDMTFERREELTRIAALAEGKAEGKAESILELLEEYGPVPEDLAVRIMGEKDLVILTKWHKISARCSSIEEFNELIG